jgi:alkylation response protein AidB-like acyl-CoA dehydrogenase
MDFNFTEEQTMLRDMVASYLADNYDFETRRGVVKSGAGWRPAVWKSFAEELGILGAGFSEADGGLGGGGVENMVVMEELGKALVLEPYLATAVIGGSLVRHADWAGGSDLAGKIISGEAILAFAYAEPQGRYTWSDLKTAAKKDGEAYILNGHKAVVVGAPYATHLLITARTSGGQRDADGVSLFLVEKAGLSGMVTRDYPTVDGMAASEIYFEDVRIPASSLVGAEGKALPLIERIIDEATVASMAEACGVLRQLHAQTMDYAQQRKQFGQPIADFQVLQHRMVDMFIHLEQAVSVTYMATIRVGSDDAIERAKAVSSAKVTVGRALKFVGEQAIQIHGGMGMTDELAISHYFKRATMLTSLFGSTDHHLRRYEGLSFGKAA